MAKKTHILLVDDDLSVREALGQVLQDENFQVVSAASGSEALSKIGENQIDVALLDLNLGREDGWDTFERLSGLQPCLPVIVMSARPDSFAHTCAPAAAALMEKPLDIPLLFRKLQDLSSLGAAWKAACDVEQAKTGSDEESA